MMSTTKHASASAQFLRDNQRFIGFLQNQNWAEFTEERSWALVKYHVLHAIQAKLEL